MGAELTGILSRKNVARILGWGLLIAALSCLIRLLHRQNPHFDDWFVYAVGGQKSLSGRTVYDVLGHFTYNYPPFSALFYGFTLASLPAQLGPQIWWYLSLSSWVLITTFWIWRSRPSQDAIPWTALFALCAFGLSLLSELKLSQTHAIPMLAVIAAILLEDREFEIASGLLIGFAVQMKITFGLIPLAFLAQKRWKIALTAFASHFLYSGVLFALYHGIDFTWSENLAWLEGLGPRSQKALIDAYNVSSQAIWFRLTDNTSLKSGVTLVGIIATCYRAWKNRSEPFDQSIAFALTAVLFCNPLIWPYWWLLALPLCTFVFSKAQRLPHYDSTIGRMSLLAIAVWVIAASLAQDTYTTINGVYLLSWGLTTFAAAGIFFWASRVLEVRESPTYAASSKRR